MKENYTKKSPTDGKKFDFSSGTIIIDESTVTLDLHKSLSFIRISDIVAVVLLDGKLRIYSREGDVTLTVSLSKKEEETAREAVFEVRKKIMNEYTGVKRL